MEKVDTSKIMPGKSYLVIVEHKSGLRHACVAVWYPDKSEVIEDEGESYAEDWGVWSEEKQAWCLPEGWYEQTYEQDTNMRITGDVTQYEEINWPQRIPK